MAKFERRLTLPIPSRDLFAWHERPGAFERLCPPWDPVEIIHKDEHIRDGAIAKLKVKGPLGIPLTLKVTHEDYVEGVQFVDRQLSGPFASWRHTHSVSEELDQKDSNISEESSNEGLERSTLIDSIEYQLPLGPLGELGGGAMTRSRLAQLFHYRHEVMRHDNLLHRSCKTKNLHIAISGATGLIVLTLIGPFLL